MLTLGIAGSQHMNVSHPAAAAAASSPDFGGTERLKELRESVQSRDDSEGVAQGGPEALLERRHRLLAAARLAPAFREQTSIRHIQDQER